MSGSPLELSDFSNHVVGTGRAFPPESKTTPAPEPRRPILTQLCQELLILPGTLSAVFHPFLCSYDHGWYYTFDNEQADFLCHLSFPNGLLKLLLLFYFSEFMLYFFSPVILQAPW